MRNRQTEKERKKYILREIRRRGYEITTKKQTKKGQTAREIETDTNTVEAETDKAGQINTKRKQICRETEIER